MSHPSYPSDFRPISILQALSKCLEQINNSHHTLKQIIFSASTIISPSPTPPSLSIYLSPSSFLDSGYFVVHVNKNLVLNLQIFYISLAWNIYSEIITVEALQTMLIIYIYIQSYNSLIYAQQRYKSQILRQTPRFKAYTTAYA